MNLLGWFASFEFSPKSDGAMVAVMCLCLARSAGVCFRTVQAPLFGAGGTGEGGWQGDGTVFLCWTAAAYTRGHSMVHERVTAGAAHGILGNLPQSRISLYCIAW